MKIKRTQILEFNIDKERFRLYNLFNGEALDRQLKILDAFSRGDFEESIRLYNKLPYSDDDECTEREYVDMFISDFLEKYAYSNKEDKFEIINEFDDSE